jgi:hypothetical protein
MGAIQDTEDKAKPAVVALKGLMDHERLQKGR